MICTRRGDPYSSKLPSCQPYNVLDSPLRNVLKIVFLLLLLSVCSQHTFCRCSLPKKRDLSYWTGTQTNHSREQRLLSVSVNFIVVAYQTETTLPAVRLWSQICGAAENRSNWSLTLFERGYCSGAWTVIIPYISWWTFYVRRTSRSW